MVTPLNADTLDAYIARVNAIHSPDQRLWGALDPAPLMAHLRRTFEIALGEYVGEDISNWFSKSVMKWMAFHVLPWPKGKLKAPAEFTPDADGELDAERQRAIDAMRRFVETAQREPDRIGVSPLFGPMTLRYWQHVQGKHLDHHLRQYGV